MEVTEVTITKTLENKKAILSVEGWLDTNSAPELGREIEALSDIESLILDFDKLEYISSAGLRILLSTQKIMNKQGSMVIKNVNEDVMDIFNITGFADFLTIE
jgi:anti-anti-sigma factor